MNLAFGEIDHWKELDAAVIDDDVGRLAQPAIATAIYADDQHAPVRRSVSHQEANVRFDATHLAAARIDGMNKAEAMYCSPIVAMLNLNTLHVSLDAPLECE